MPCGEPLLKEMIDNSMLLNLNKVEATLFSNLRESVKASVQIEVESCWSQLWLNVASHEPFNEELVVCINVTFKTSLF